MNNYAYLIKKAKATDSRIYSAGSPLNLTHALNAKFWISWKTLKLMLAAVPTTNCRSAQTGISLTIFQKKMSLMKHGATAMNLAVKTV
jgi:hypothetical protein